VVALHVAEKKSCAVNKWEKKGNSKEYEKSRESSEMARGGGRQTTTLERRKTKRKDLHDNDAWTRDEG